MRRCLCTVSTGVLACAAACTSGDGRADSLVVRDSAGITIVARRVPAAEGNSWRIGSTESSVGNASEELGHELYRVVGAARLNDGAIVIANAGTGELRRYASDGTYRDATGRTGDGPGEFKALSWLGRAENDSLIVWDRGTNRVTVFSGVLRARDYTPHALPETPMSLEARGILGRGQLLLSRGASFIPSGGDVGVQRQPLSAYLLAPSGEFLQEFGPFAGEAVDLRPGRQPGSTIRTPVPFGGATLVAAGADHVFVADNAAYDIRVYDGDGRLRRILRRPHDPVPLRPEDVQAEIERRLEALPPIDEIRAGSRARLEAVPTPGVLPALRAMLVDLEGYLWVEAGRPANEQQSVWSVFHPMDGWHADIRLPAEQQLLEIGQDYLIVRSRDALDVEVVQVIALHRG